MYIRRKVFSKIGEKTFSTTEFQTQKEFAEKKEDDKNKAEKIGKTVAKVGAAGTAVGVASPIIAAGFHPMKKAIKDIPVKAVIKQKIGRNLNEKDIKNLEKGLDSMSKSLNSAALRNQDTYVRRARATKVVKGKVGRNAKIGLGVTGAGIALNAAGKIKKKVDNSKQD